MQKIRGIESFHIFEYQDVSFTKDGKEKNIEFTSNKILCHGAYIKLIYNYRKGVTSWEAINKSGMQPKALYNLKMEESENN